jgi:hypothetical protein
METFILAAVSLAVAVSTLFSRRREGVHWSFAPLGLALFLVKTGSSQLRFFRLLMHPLKSLAFFFSSPAVFLDASPDPGSELLPYVMSWTVVLVVLAATALSFAILGSGCPSGSF